MKHLVTVSGLSALIATSLFAISPESLEKLDINGAAVSTYSYNQVSGDTIAGFDLAANLDFSYQISDTYSAFVQLQGGAGNGNLGFVGPEVVVTDLSFSYAKKQTEITVGSFDTPFGRQTYRLTNNGDTSGHPLLANDLLYSAFAGPVGTLNTLGIKGQYTFKPFYVLGSVSNGTGESAFTQSNTFQSLLQIGSTTLIPHSQTSLSLLHSDDQKDPSSSTETNSFATELCGWLLDYSISPKPGIRSTVYFGELTYDDGISNTQDSVQVFMIEAEAAVKNFVGSARFSSWTPEDTSGNGAGMSEDLPSPGLSNQIDRAALTDQKVTRIQLGVGHEIQPGLFLNLELLQDNYEHGENLEAAYVYLSTTF